MTFLVFCTTYNYLLISIIQEWNIVSDDARDGEICTKMGFCVQITS